MNNDFDPRFRDVLLDNMTVNIDVIEGHIFSHRYMRMRKRILRRYRHLPAASPVGVKHQQHRLRYAIIAVIVSTALIVGFTAWYTINGFIFKSGDGNGQIIIIAPDVLSSYPSQLVNHFFLDTDMSAYDSLVECDDEFNYCVQFSNESGDIIVVSQWIAGVYDGSSWINTEDAKIMPIEVTVNGYKGFYFETKNDQCCYTIVFDDCVMEYTTNTDRETIDKLVKSTKFK